MYTLRTRHLNFKSVHFLLFVFGLNWFSGKLSMEAIQVVFEQLSKKGTICSHSVEIKNTYLTAELWIHFNINTFESFCRLNSGNLEWLDKNKSRCLVMWRRPEEWGKLIYQWVSHQIWRQTVLSVKLYICGTDEG